MSLRMPALILVTTFVAARAYSQCDAPTAPRGDVVISEIQPRGDVHWVELFNAGETDACLDNFSLEIRNVRSNTVLGRNEGEFDLGTVISPGDYLLKCLFVEPKVPPQDAPAQCLACRDSATCTKADLDKDGGTVVLWWTPPCEPALAEKADVIRYPPVPEGGSFGRAGDSLCVFGTPTPGAPNGACEPALSSVLLNEISTNASSFVHFSSQPDWLEIRCVGPDPVDLAGYRLRSEGNTLVFPADRPERTFMEPDSVLLIVCDGDDGEVDCCPRDVMTGACCSALECDEQSPGERTCFDGTYFHAPFALARGGDSVGLIAPDGSSDRVVIPRLEEGEVFARQPDGEWFLSLCPTPLEPNENGTRTCGVPPDVEFIDRFPLRVEPGNTVDVIVEVSDRDDNLDSVTLLWWFDGDGPAELPMTLGKRVSCERVPGEIIYVQQIPNVPGPGILEIQVEARDRDGNSTRSEPHRFRVQESSEPTGLVINEIAAASVLRDPNGGEAILGEWIELYNAGDHALDLTDLVVTDSVFDLAGRRIAPQIPELSPGGFLVLHTSGDVTRSTPTEIHLPFRLSRCAEQVVIYAPDGETVIDALRFHEEKNEATLGRIPDGARDVIGLTSPTPASPNVALACTTSAELGFPIGDLVINEVCADNWTIVPDARQEFGDWVEIYNRGVDAVALEGWRLRDRVQVDLGDPGWAFPSATLEPGEFLLVWCDNDSACEDGLGDELHANFEINRLFDLVELVAPDGSVADHVRVEYQYRDISVARVPDGASDFRPVHPSPNGANVGVVVSALLFDSCIERCPFTRADSNRDGVLGISDPVHTLNFLFLGESRTTCPDALDSNDDGSINLSDAVYTLSFLFLAGAAPPPPFPSPGPDPSPDTLQCDCD